MSSVAGRRLAQSLVALVGTGALLGLAGGIAAASPAATTVDRHAAVAYRAGVATEDDDWWYYAGTFDSEANCNIHGAIGQWFGEWAEYQCFYSEDMDGWVLWVRSL
jgi:hypothetical protein